MSPSSASANFYSTDATNCAGKSLSPSFFARLRLHRLQRDGVFHPTVTRSHVSRIIAVINLDRPFETRLCQRTIRSQSTFQFVKKKEKSEARLKVASFLWFSISRDLDTYIIDMDIEQRSSSSLFFEIGWNFYVEKISVSRVLKRRKPVWIFGI